MGEKKVLAVMMFVMAYGLAVTRLSYSQIPATCNGDEKLLSFCGEYLVNNVPNPSSDCCNSASDAFKRAMANGQGIRDICNCLRAAESNLNFHRDKLLSLPDKEAMEALIQELPTFKLDAVPTTCNDCFI